MSAFKNIALLLARVILGIILIYHGWDKFGHLADYSDNFAAMGVPASSVATVVAAVIELGGGILLLIGLMTSIAGSLVFLVMLGAYFFAHMGNGVAAADGGFELVGAIGAAALALAGAGAGVFSVDAVLNRRRVTTADADADGAVAARTTTTA